MDPNDFQAIRGQHLAGRRVEFSRRTLLHGAADGSTFTDCEIVLDPKGMPAFRGGARVWFADVSFSGCAITATSKVHDLNLDGQVRLERCRFVGGPFTEPKFGLGPREKLPDCGPESMVMQCDFSQADLRDARFYQTRIEELRLSGWPYITVLARDGDVIYAPESRTRPALTELVDAVAAFEWGDRAMWRAIDSLVFAVGGRPDEATVQVCHVDDVVKRGAGSAERLRVALDRFAHPAIRY